MLTNGMESSVSSDLMYFGYYLFLGMLFRCFAPHDCLGRCQR
jgi:hypothetical protein